MKVRILLAALILFSLIAVPGAVATSYDYEETLTHSAIGSGSGIYSGSTPDSATWTLKAFEIENIQYYKKLLLIKNIPAYGALSVPEASQSFPVNLKVDGTVIGTGSYDTWRQGSTGWWQLTVDTWDIGDLTGTKSVVMEKADPSGPGTFGTGHTVYRGAYPTRTFTPATHAIRSPSNNYPIAFSTWWEDNDTNRYTASTNGVLYNIQLYRTVNGETAPSTVIITDGAGSVLEQSTLGSVDLDKSTITPPINLAVKFATSPWFNRTFYETTNNATATIYIRDASTGNLITNARVIINDATTEPPTEMINEVLPLGTKQFDLLKSPSLKYHASATASGYTPFSPILFGLGDDGVTIILWMYPDTPPDDPIEEGKSLLYGYALTQGSQQPISGATVALNGYGTTTTTSTGFYSFVNVTPGDYSITATATTHDPLSEIVTVAAPSTQHNMALTGQHTLTITAKDADTLANIQNATISLSDGQESTQNPITFTVDYGTYTITTAAEGYYPANQYQYIDSPGTTTATVLMTAKPEPIPTPEMPNYPPHNVKFSVLTMLGAPISGVNVTAQGIQQTPSSNILERLLGLNMTATPINTESMNGTTDSNGEINFMMVEAVKYQITLYKPDVVNQTLEIYPKEDTYPIRISTLGGSLLPDAGDPLRSILVNVTTSTSGDTGHIHVDYNDTTHKTTALSIQVTQQNTTDSSAPEDVIASHTVANDANVSHTFDLSDYKGHSYFIRLEAEHPDFTTVHRDYAVAFKGVRVPLGPLPDGLYIYVAGFALMLLGGIFTATSATRGVVVIALAGWLFYGFGWLDDLGLAGPAALGLVTVLAIFGVIVTRYKEEGYQ